MRCTWCLAPIKRGEGQSWPDGSHRHMTTVQCVMELRRVLERQRSSLDKILERVRDLESRVKGTD